MALLEDSGVDGQFTNGVTDGHTTSHSAEALMNGHLEMFTNDAPGDALNGDASAGKSSSCLVLLYCQSISTIGNGDGYILR